MARFARRARLWAGLGLVGVAAGCSSRPLALPNGYLPPPQPATDQQSAQVLAADAARTAAKPPPPAPTMLPGAVPGGPGKPPPFDLPAFPGGDVPPVKPPVFDKDTPAAERDRAVRAAYPRFDSPGRPTGPSGTTGPGLAELQAMALEGSPVIKRAVADADAAYGRVIQAGLYPNPTVGYQVDQWQPGPKPSPLNNSGQQGGFINQLIKTAGKLGLAQQVAGYDYVNALVAVHRAKVSVITAVRTSYFAALVAQESLDVSRSLADLAGEVYGLQLRQVAGGQTAGYEPLQLYAQAEQARNAVDQADAAYRAAWKQLAAALGQPDLPVSALSGRADTPAPAFDLEAAKERMLEQHTDVLTAKNSIAQAQTNLVYQKKQVIPDVTFNNYHQYDNAASNYQFGIQVGFAIPVSDRNQGNIRAAQAQIMSNSQQLAVTQNALLGQLAEAYGRYEAAVKVAARYRERILPTQTQAYRLLVRRYQVEPDKVGFNDIVVAQQALATSLQAYLTALQAQWQAVVDVANAVQQEELYPPAAVVAPPVVIVK